MTDRALSRFTEKLALRFYAALDTPVSLGLAIKLRHGDVRGVVTTSIDPRNYVSPDSFRRDAMAVAFLKKCEDLPVEGVNQEAEAKAVFLEGNLACFSTNRRLRRIRENASQGYFANRGDEHAWDFLMRVKSRVRKIMGPLPEYIGPRFGPGATLSDPKAASLVPDKMTSDLTHTNDLHEIVSNHLGQTAWGRALNTLGKWCGKRVRSGGFFYAPKNALTKRACIKEPSLNAAYQRGTGHGLAKRLTRAGLDIQTGKDRHMQLACVASLDGSLTTVDVKNASNTIAYELVKIVCEDTWFSWLDSLRAPYVNIDGQDYRLEMFSSMGNGFTFELETIIFAAITAEICSSLGVNDEFGEAVSVFGDDIILPSVVSQHELVTAFRFCGFELHPTKSFFDSNFRESCGGDYFLGIPCRGFYLDSQPAEPADYIALANGIRRLPDFDHNPALHGVWLMVLDELPEQIKCLRGPSHLGDLVVNDPDESRWCLSVKNSITYIRVWSPIQRKTHWRWAYEVQLAAALYGVRNVDTALNKNGCREAPYLVARDSVEGYKIAFQVLSRPKRLPPWLHEFEARVGLG